MLQTNCNTSWHLCLASLVLILLVTTGAVGQDAFVTTWQTDLPGSSNAMSITIPTTGGGYQYSVDWENDGIVDVVKVEGSITHEYESAGTYTVAIYGEFPRIFFNGAGDKDKILSVDQWGDIQWTSMLNAFNGCSNLKINATDAPDLTQVTDMDGCFKNASSLEDGLAHWDVSNIVRMFKTFEGASSYCEDLDQWDVSNVEIMGSMFKGAHVFNGDISTWDVSSVTYMRFMFFDAHEFNGAIGEWDVANVESMGNMFENAYRFNRDLAGWNTSSVTGMNSMFRRAYSFNGYIGNWDVSNVQYMSTMFYDADSFNQNIGDWDVSSVDNMYSMFRFNDAFNQDIGDWDVSGVLDMSLMFYSATKFSCDLGRWDLGAVNGLTLAYSGMTVSDFDKSLKGWASQNVSNANVQAHGLKYCSAQSERNELVGDGWDIQGDEMNCDGAAFVTTWQTTHPGISNSTSITIPTKGGGYSYDVDWDNDGTFDTTGIDGSITHDFGVAGVHTIRIQGEFPRIFFGDSGDKEKILSVDQWGSIEWTSMDSAFYGAANLVINAEDKPDLSLVTSAVAMFKDAENVNPDMGDWRTERITDMSHMLQNATSFNNDLSCLDIDSVGSMEQMLAGVRISTPDYDKMLHVWSRRSVMDSVDFGVGLSKFCNDSARAYLIDSLKWTISDGGNSTVCCVEEVMYRNGAWSPYAPSNGSYVIIKDDYNTALSGGFDACEILIMPGAELLVAANDTLSVGRGITVRGVLTTKPESVVSIVDP